VVAVGLATALQAGMSPGREHLQKERGSGRVPVAVETLRLEAPWTILRGGNARKETRSKAAAAMPGPAVEQPIRQMVP